MTIDWHRILKKKWKICVIQYYGRSGSTFLHSLLDGHSKVLALPIVGFQDFYTQTLPAKNEFTFSYYEPLIEALGFPNLIRSDKHKFFQAGRVDGNTETPDKLLEEVYKLPEINGGKFIELMKGFFDSNLVSRKNTFLAFHISYCLAAGMDLIEERDTILYQMHHPNEDAFRKILHDFSDVRLIQTIREPSNALASNLNFFSKIYPSGIPFWKLEQVLDRAFFAGHFYLGEYKAISIRLEDLHNEPGKTLGGLAPFCGINLESSLFQSSILGKGIKWGYDSKSLFRSMDFQWQYLRVFSSQERQCLAPFLSKQYEAWRYPMVEKKSDNCLLDCFEGIVEEEGKKKLKHYLSDLSNRLESYTNQKMIPSLKL